MKNDAPPPGRNSRDKEFLTLFEQLRPDIQATIVNLIRHLAAS